MKKELFMFKREDMKRVIPIAGECVGKYKTPKGEEMIQIKFFDHNKKEMTVWDFNTKHITIG